MKLMKTTKTMMRTAAFAAIVAASTLLPSVARAQPASAGCTPGLLPVPLPHGALAAICMPPIGWNGKLVVPDRALELMRVANAAYDPANPATIANTTLDLLRTLQVHPWGSAGRVWLDRESAVAAILA